MRKTFIITTFLMLFVIPGLYGQSLPLDNNFHSYQNRLVGRLIDRGILDLEFWSSRPYTIDDIRNAAQKALEESDINLSALDRSLLLAIIEDLNRFDTDDSGLHAGLDFSSAGISPQNGKSYSAESLRGRFGLKLRKNIGLWTEFALDESLADDTMYEGKVWRSLAGQVELAYVQFDMDNVIVSAGRQKSSWGPGRRGNMLLSSHSQAMDQIKLEAEYGPARFTSIIAVLDREENMLHLVDTSLDWDINRYFSAHRLEVMPYDKLSLGVSESVIYGGAGRSLELYYSNPLTWYHGEQLNEKNDDNTFISFDATWYPKWGVKLYGELLIDDYQIDNETAGDNEPSEIGYLAGFNLIEPIGIDGLDFSFEYARVNNWTYNQKNSHNRYIHHNRLIGHFLGPDRESYYFAVKKWFGWGAWAILSYERQNSGQGNVFSDWSEPWIYAGPSYSEPFPSGTVEHMDILGLSIKLFKWRNLQIDFDNYFYFYDNMDNIRGNSESAYRGRLQVRYLMGLL